MINSVFVPLEPLEAEEDNEPPSLEKRRDLFACPCACMDSPSFSLTSVSKFIQQNPFYSDTENSRQGQVVRIALERFACYVLTFFPRYPISGMHRC